MTVLVGIALLVSLLVFIRAYRTSQSLAPSHLLLKDLLDESIEGISSVEQHMSDLRNIFCHEAYADREMRGTRALRHELRERCDRARTLFVRIDTNIAKWEKLGVRAAGLGDGQDRLAADLRDKAVACKLVFKPVQRRLNIYAHIPVICWGLLGRKMGNVCLSGGSALIKEYGELAELVLAFTKNRGEDYQYETLLAAL